MKKRMLIMLVTVGLIFGLVFGFHAFKNHMMRKFLLGRGEPPQTVSTITVAAQRWQPEINAVGTLRAIHGVTLSPEVAGVVTHIFFHSGEPARKGMPLLELDLAPDQARLNALTATARFAAQVYARDKKEFAIQAISEAQLENDESTLANASANVLNQKALMAEKLVRAPFSGTLGLRKVDLGQYLTPGTAIADLESVDPILVDFFVPQHAVHRIARGATVSLTSDAVPGAVYAGTIEAMDAAVDTGSRNVEVRARIPNPGDHLRPGMFAVLQILSGKPAPYLTVPATAITYNPYGDTVYVVTTTRQQGKSVKVANPRFVETGPSRGDQVAILKGLSDGDVVVTAGQQKLHAGSVILINNQIVPADSANPAPQEP